jgi:hypothetical protein
MASVRQRGELQNLADRLDPESAAVFIDEGLGHFSWRSSSAWAKNALASFRFSLPQRSSLTSRSKSLTHCASALVTPSRTPLSISWR